MSVNIDELIRLSETGGDYTVLDIVVPVYNEERDLETCVRTLCKHLLTTFPYRFRITIADNASVDDTPAIASRLAAELPEVSVVRLADKGRGRALKTVWSASDAQVLAYCDVDLSTDLNAVLPLVAPLISGHSDLAIGTRLGRGAQVVRGVKREVISRCYNLILRGTLAAGFSDAQCGFKAIRADVAHRLLPLVEDPGWFFDTELLVLAERAGLRIHEDRWTGSTTPIRASIWWPPRWQISRVSGGSVGRWRSARCLFVSLGPSSGAGSCRRPGRVCRLR